MYVQRRAGQLARGVATSQADLRSAGHPSFLDAQLQIDSATPPDLAIRTRPQPNVDLNMTLAGALTVVWRTVVHLLGLFGQSD
jgi:hypothetical protein